MHTVIAREGREANVRYNKPLGCTTAGLFRIVNGLGAGDPGKHHIDPGFHFFYGLVDRKRRNHILIEITFGRDRPRPNLLSFFLRYGDGAGAGNLFQKVF